MIGEGLAFVSALCFAFGSIAIVKSRPATRSDNGLLLSIVLTGLFALAAWLFFGRPLPAKGGSEWWPAIGWFAAAGIFSTVWGRMTLYRSVQLAGVVRATTIRRLTPFFSALFAWVLLGEMLSPIATLGLAALAASFALLYIDNRKPDDGMLSKESISKGCFLALLCALTYAASYVFRSGGLAGVPDPFFGAFIGAATALLYYCVTGAISRTATIQVRSLYAVDRFQFAAASFISLGQVIQFVALNHTTVARVAVVNSVEIFLSTYLAVFIFRTERFPSALAVTATTLATIGLIAVATG